MSCVTGQCGTGEWTGPKPGDPDNNITISAQEVFGGIDVHWSYPTINGFAVAHAEVYRSLNSSFSSAVMHRIAAGSFIYDKLNPTTSTRYYYWVRLVSVNGTVNDPIGPASAVARPVAEQTLESLTDRIDKSVLGQALKTDIANITLLNGKLSTEIQDRINNNTALSTALGNVTSGLEASMAFISNEITQRKDAVSAAVTATSTLATAVGQNLSLFIDEKTSTANQFGAVATRFDLMLTKMGNDIAAAVLVEKTARVNKDEAFASSIETVQATLNGNVASGQVGLTAKVNAITGAIEAMFIAKLSVNGFIGGFGVYNDGREVMSIFDVDTFAVGRTNADKVKPFIIANGIVYMDKARIRDADIDTLKIKGNAVSIPVFLNGYGVNNQLYTVSQANVLTLLATTNVTYSTDPAVTSRVAIIVNWQALNSGPAGTATAMTVKIDGVVVMFWSDNAIPGWSHSHSGSIGVTLGPGAHTIELFVSKPDNAGSFALSNWSILALGSMR